MLADLIAKLSSLVLEALGHLVAAGADLKDQISLAAALIQRMHHVFPRNEAGEGQYVQIVLAAVIVNVQRLDTVAQLEDGGHLIVHHAVGMAHIPGGTEQRMVHKFHKGIEILAQNWKIGSVRAMLDGGVLTIQVGEDNQITMTGPAETVFEGEVMKLKK